MKAKKKKSNSNIETITCIPECIHQFTACGQMCQCHLCQKWHHEDCLEISPPVGLWTSSSCRKMTETLLTMSEVMNKILQSNIELHAMVKQQQREMSVMANHLTALTDELYSTKNDGFTTVSSTVRESSSSVPSSVPSARKAGSSSSSSSRQSTKSTSSSTTSTSSSTARTARKTSPTSSSAPTSTRTSTSSRQSTASTTSTSSSTALTARKTSSTSSSSPTSTRTSTSTRQSTASTSSTTSPPTLTSTVRPGHTFAEAVSEPNQQRAVVPDVVIIGTSLVRGVGNCMSEVNSMVYTYPGQELPQLQQNVLNIFTPAYQPAHVIIQCGGNDAANRPTHKVVLGYDRLVNNVRKACPKSIITLGIIPPRGTDHTILENIAKVNTYITNRGNRGDGVVSSDLCPCDYQHYKTDLIHFNQTGTQIFACRLATHIASFRVCPQ